MGDWANRCDFWSAATCRRFKSADKSAHSKGSGFTLLEIMLAVGILGLMSLAIFRFVQANTTALQLSSDTAARDSQYDGLRDLLTSEWQSLTSVRSKCTGNRSSLMNGNVIGYGGTPVLVLDS